MKELDVLFDKWEQKHKEAGYQRFIRDGIVDEEWWMQEQTAPKICFFLKEARTEEENYNLVKDLYRYKPWRLWQRVAVWTQAIHNAFLGELPYNDEQIKKNAHEAVKKIAVVNVKKSDGLPNSEEQDLRVYLEQDKAELKEEIELINPDIILCGYTFGMLKDVLGDELYVDTTSDTMYGFWRDKLIIDYYHPACQYPNRINYYALMSICRMAEKEWRERKDAYNH